MNIIAKTITFDAGHRVALHQSKCKSCHGHLYSLTAEISGELFTEGPQTEMVLDYGFLKNLMMENIHNMCDHAMILSLQDSKFMGLAYDENLTSDPSYVYLDWIDEVTDTIRKNSFWAGETAFGKTYIINGYSTAETLARHFFKILEPKVAILTKHQARLSAITINETPTSVATYRSSDEPDRKSNPYEDVKASEPNQKCSCNSKVCSCAENEECDRCYNNRPDWVGDWADDSDGPDVRFDFPEPTQRLQDVYKSPCAKSCSCNKTKGL